MYFSQYNQMVIQENVFENVICKISAILFEPHGVKEVLCLWLSCFSLLTKIYNNE